MEKYCTLCHNSISAEESEIIDKLTKEVFSILLLNLDLDDETEHLMCRTCSAKLFGALEFKSICLETDSSLLPFANCEDIISLNLHDVYLKISQNQHKKDIMPDHKLCRLCMHLVNEEYVAVDEIDAGLIRLYIPEVNFLISKDPVICKPCFESFNMFSRFIKNCLDINEKMNSDCSDRSEHFEPSISENKVESEAGDFECTRHQKMQGTSKTVPSDKQSDGFKCSRCDFVCVRTTDMKNHLMGHGITEKIEWYRCLPCNYRTRSTKHLWQHLNHRHKLTGTWHTCRVCGFKAKYAVHLDNHQCVRRHGVPKRKQLSSRKRRWLKCVLCGYKTESKAKFADHQAEFGDGSCAKRRQAHPVAVNEELYKCEECDYQGRGWKVFRKHMERHTDQNGPLYYCNMCKYQSPLKRALAYHYRVQHQTTLDRAQPKRK